MAPKVTVKNGRLSTRLSNLSDTNLLLAITIAVFLLMYALAVVVLGDRKSVGRERVC